MFTSEPSAGVSVLARPEDEGCGLPVVMRFSLVDTGFRLLRFRAGRLLFGVESVRVEAILPDDGLIAVPPLQSGVCGVLHRRGQVVPVLDLARRLTGEPLLPGSYAAIVLVDVPAVDGEKQVGLLADEVLGECELFQGEVDVLPPDGGRGGVVHGVADVAGETLLVLDVTRLDVPRVRAFRSTVHGPGECCA